MIIDDLIKVIESDNPVQQSSNLQSLVSSNGGGRVRMTVDDGAYRTVLV